MLISFIRSTKLKLRLIMFMTFLIELYWKTWHFLHYVTSLTITEI